MSKRPVKSTTQGSAPLSFNVFWQTIANDLGNSRVKVNPKADSIKHFLRSDSDHRDFLRVIIQQSYKRCQCYHLNARFDVNIALDVLGETAFTLTGNKEDDLLDIELLEEIAWIINHHFADKIKMPQSLLDDSNVGKSDRETNSNSVVSLSNRKIQRANQIQ